MKFQDLLKMCLDDLKRRKGRTILTALGVFIGCTSIIVMVSLGVGVRESQEEMIKNMGDISTIQVYEGYETESVKLTDESVKTFKEIANVECVMPKVSPGDYGFVLSAGIGDRYQADWCELVAVDMSVVEKMGYELTEGNYPVGARGSEVLVGQYLAYNFRDSYKPEGRNFVDRYVWDENGNLSEDVPDAFFDPMQTPMRLGVYNYNSEDGGTPIYADIKVTGVLKEDNGKGWETSEGMMIDMNTLKGIISKTTGLPPQQVNLDYNEIVVKVNDIKNIQDVETEIKGMGYNTSSMLSISEELGKEARRLELLLGGLGAISLLVAAIGITNTMIMSISERTKEIGIMKAMGCYVKDIRMLFLMEAGSIGLIGGLAGIVFSHVISVIVNLFNMGAFGQGLTGEIILQALFGGEGVSRLSVISPELIIFAVIFSVAVGLISGYYPANKAVKISALEAIRNE